MAHSHDHSHDQSTRNLLYAFMLNFAFSIIELIGGYLTGSVAILSDALHDFGDSISLGSALILEKMAARSATRKFSYGFRRLSLLSAFINAMVLIIGSLVILAEAIPRLISPETPHLDGMLFLAVIGIAVNGFAAMKLQKGNTLNEKVISWHLFEDVFGWVAIFFISILMRFFDLPILDPLLSVFFTLYILRGVVKTIQETLKLFLQATPESVDINSLKEQMMQLQGVVGLHDTHIWSLDGHRHVLTTHVVVKKDLALREIAALKSEIKRFVTGKGHIHLTIEIETEEEVCPEVDCSPN